MKKYLDRFMGKKILVIGDVMLDKYVWGRVSRISPEAPVPIVVAEKESYAPGGAANVANNVAELGGLVRVVGLVGDDSAAKVLMAELQKRSIVTDTLVTDSTKPTIQKVRIISHNQQLIRIDYEKIDGMTEGVIKRLKSTIEANIRDVDAIIVSDYAKGVIQSEVAACILDLAKRYGKHVIVDAKPKNAQLFNGATVLLPNHNEAMLIAGVEEVNDGNLEEVGVALVNKMNSSIIITRGEKGLSIFNKNGEITHMPTKAREVYDVTGAGDTMTAVVALALSAGASLEDAATIGNYAAGIVVGKVGTSTVNVGEIRESLQNE
ncbi:MAG: D-glycero-beta-D-manno-heptose-7-phosphate kinase [Candidatus Woesearchaeota archaeon]